MSTSPEISYLLKNINRQICCIKNGQNNPSEITFNPTSQDAFGRLRTSEPFTLFDSSNRYQDNGLWATSTASGGTATFNADQGLMDLTVDGTLGSTVVRETYKVFAYQPGKSLLILSTFVMSPVETGLVQRVGYFGDDNGFYVELNKDDGLGFIKRSVVTGSLVETPVLQANWNGDKLDGTGPSGLTIDITKAQILWIDMEWLGVGSVRMGFVINGQFILCHTFQHANVLDSTYITTACLPIRYEIFLEASTNNTHVLKQICSSVISEGGYELRGTQNTVGLAINAPYTWAAANTYKPIIGLRLKSTRLDAIVILTAISLLGNGSGVNYAWRIVQGATIPDGTWTDTLIGTSSPVQYNLTGTSSSGGRVLASGYLNSSNQASPVVNILKGSLFSAQLERNGLTGTPLELVLEVAAGSTPGGHGLLASMDWDEVTR